MTVFTPAQVLALAPDPGAAKAARALGVPVKWMNTGQREHLVWGEHQGSGKDPYRIAVDVSEPAFTCSCPSRKFPCKHGLALLLVHAQDAQGFATASAPAWAAEWLTSRKTRSRQQAVKPETAAATPVSLAKSRAKPSTAARERKMADGLHELGLWLADLLRAGLLHAQAQPRAFWRTAAARMIDAQLPGLASGVNELGSVVHSGGGWQSRALQLVARMHLLAQAHAHLASLPDDAQADVRAALGLTTPQEQIMALPGMADTWHVLGQRVLEDAFANSERSALRTQRTWLWGEHNQRLALLLNFSIGARGFENPLLPATRFAGELVFYPSATPQRALVKTRAAFAPTLALPAAESMVAAIHRHATAIAENPWLTHTALQLRAITPQQVPGGWMLRNADGQQLAIASAFANSWSLRALSGGRPLDVCVEWDGGAAWPLSACTSDRMVLL